jgi:uncharacterized membrane protein YhaH (DUF805 family)
MEWMILPLKRYAQFTGRSRRMEYWMWVLFVILAMIVLSILDTVLGLGGRSSVSSVAPGPAGSISYGYGARAYGGVLTGIFGLATLIPGIAVSVRRLHDRDRSGWWILAPGIPYIVGIILTFVAAVSVSWVLMMFAMLLFFAGFIGAIVLLVWYCLPGTAGPNRFGPDPLDITNEQLAQTFE